MRRNLILILAAAVLVSAAATLLIVGAVQAQSAVTVTISAKVDVRAGPGTGYTRLAQMEKGSVVKPIGRNADATWLVYNFVDGRRAWFAISRTAMKIEGTVRSLPVFAAPPIRAGGGGSSGGGVVIATAAPGAPGCPGLQFTCSMFNTCAEAQACLAAGNKSLDRDKDGVPCESICPGG